MMTTQAMTNRWLMRCAVLILPMLAGPLAQAQTEYAYVTDRLQLGVHMQPDTSDRPFAKLKSGDRVEMLEETRFHAFVTMPDGRKGWVKKTYLVTDKPAVLVVAEVEQERDRALADLESLRTGLGDRESQVAAMEAAVAEREQAAQAKADELDRLRIENTDLNERLDAYAFSVPGSVFFVAVAVSLIIGALLTWWWLDRRSRRRHGGFRIY